MARPPARSDRSTSARNTADLRGTDSVRGQAGRERQVRRSRSVWRDWPPPKAATAGRSRDRIACDPLTQVPDHDSHRYEQMDQRRNGSFSGPRQTLSVAGGNANLGERKLPAQVSVPKFVHFAIAALIGAFVSIALVVLLMRAPVEPSRAASESARPVGSGTLVTGGRSLVDLEGTKPITASPTAINSTRPTLNPPTTAAPDARLATSRAERKTASSHPASKRTRTRLSFNDQAERKETTRLMVDELSQRGTVPASGSRKPE